MIKWDDTEEIMAEMDRMEKDRARYKKRAEVAEAKLKEAEETIKYQDQMLKDFRYARG